MFNKFVDIICISLIIGYKTINQILIYYKLVTLKKQFKMGQNAKLKGWGVNVTYAQCAMHRESKRKYGG